MKLRHSIPKWYFPRCPSTEATSVKMCTLFMIMKSIKGDTYFCFQHCHYFRWDEIKLFSTIQKKIHVWLMFLMHTPLCICILHTHACIPMLFRCKHAHTHTHTHIHTHRHTHTHIYTHRLKRSSLIKNESQCLMWKSLPRVLSKPQYLWVLLG